MIYEQVIVVRSKTRLELLIERFNTKAQAQFYLERSGEDFQIIEKEHESFYAALNDLNKLLHKVDKYKVIDRLFLPNYLFAEKDLIIGIGQDGLIANIAKYVNGQPIVGFNPNPSVYDGVLLPFDTLNEKQFVNILHGEFDSERVTMAKASFSDGQELLAFNDFFIGPKSHTSARYTLRFKDQEEQQSSSGIIVSTGAGSTGWMSSITNMVNGIGGNQISMTIGAEQEKLCFAVREPFVSQTSQANICAGMINRKESLLIESNMVNNGKVFSDGIENDFIEFNIGTKVEISLADKKAVLVQA
ncbi:MAG: sugar kinase [Bacteroidota bacterium]